MPIMKIVRIGRVYTTISTATWKILPVNGLKRQISSTSGSPSSSSSPHNEDNKDKKYHRPVLGFLTQAEFSKVFHRQYEDLYGAYERFVHLDDVRVQQEKVVELQEQLQKAQERRRALSQEITLIRKDLQTIYDELNRCHKSDDRYVKLIQEEYAVLKKEREKLHEFNSEEEAERNIFTHLTAAVRNSHEKERNYERTVKYWSIIGSILGAGLGVLATVISYSYRNDHHRTINEKVDFLNKRMGFLERQSSEIIGKLKTHPSESWTSFAWRHTKSIPKYIIPGWKDS